MREILFKGFHPDKNGTTEITLNGEKIKGEWVEGDFSQPSNICFETVGYDELLKQDNVPIWNDYDVHAETVGEYTGLLDKNGKKIFEGDIVQAPSNLAGTEFYIGTIEFGNFNDYNGNIYTGFFVKWHNVPEYSTLRQSIIWWKDEQDRFLKVIGNIFENPELLEAKS